MQYIFEDIMIERIKELFGRKKGKPEERKVRREKRDISFEEEEWLSYYIS